MEVNMNYINVQQIPKAEGRKIIDNEKKDYS